MNLFLPSTIKLNEISGRDNAIFSTASSTNAFSLWKPFKNFFLTGTFLNKSWTSIVVPLFEAVSSILDLLSKSITYLYPYKLSSSFLFVISMTLLTEAMLDNASPLNP